MSNIFLEETLDIELEEFNSLPDNSLGRPTLSKFGYRWKRNTHPKITGRTMTRSTPIEWWLGKFVKPKDKTNEEFDIVWQRLNVLPMEE